MSARRCARLRPSIPAAAAVGYTRFVANNLVRRGSPPSSYAVQALLEGEPGSVGRVLEATLLRTVFVLPGLYFATPYRGRRLLGVAIACSGSITLSLILYYGLRKNGIVDDDED